MKSRILRGVTWAIYALGVYLMVATVYTFYLGPLKATILFLNLFLVGYIILGAISELVGENYALGFVMLGLLAVVYFGSILFLVAKTLKAAGEWSKRK